MRRMVLAAIACLMVICAVLAVRGSAQDDAKPKAPQGGFPDLVGALKMTPGVLGVDAARTMSG